MNVLEKPILFEFDVQLVFIQDVVRNEFRIFEFNLDLDCPVLEALYDVVLNSSFI